MEMKKVAAFVAKAGISFLAKVMRSKCWGGVYRTFTPTLTGDLLGVQRNGIASGSVFRTGGLLPVFALSSYLYINGETTIRTINQQV
jgi:hypothetical protein